MAIQMRYMLDSDETVQIIKTNSTLEMWRKSDRRSEKRDSLHHQG